MSEDARQPSRRKLPWETNDDNDAKVKKRAKRPKPSITGSSRQHAYRLLHVDDSAKPSRAKDEGNANVFDLDDINNKPAALPTEYMIDGFEADDKYMMVEDEFEVVAKLFTRHLHHAEYIDYQKRVKARKNGLAESKVTPSVAAAPAATANEQGALERAHYLSTVEDEVDSKLDRLISDAQIRRVDLSGATALNAGVPEARADSISKIELCNDDDDDYDSDDLDAVRPEERSFAKSQFTETAQRHEQPRISIEPFSHTDTRKHDTALQTPTNTIEDTATQPSSGLDWLAKRRAAIEKKRVAADDIKPET